MNKTRTLPIRPEPWSGESLASYVDRLAYLYGVRILTILSRTGVIHKDHGSYRPRGYGVFLPPDRLQAFAFTTRLPAKRVSEMLLSRYDGLALSFQEHDFEDPRMLTKASFRQWAYFSGSHVCPLCLRESGGAWRLAWKLPWSFVCLHHRTQLIDTCPSCERRTGAGVLGEACVPVFPSLVPEPGTCRNVLSPVPGARRSSVPVPCGHPLHETEATILNEQRPLVFDAQRRINAALQGEPQNVGGHDVAPLEYFSDLRSICALILSHALPEDLGEAPLVAQEAFQAYVDRREELRRARSEHVAAGGYWWGGPSHKSFTTTPRSAALMTAVVPAASALLDTASTEMMAESMMRFLLRTSERTSGVRRQMAVYALSERLQAAFEYAWKPRTKTIDRLGLGRGEKRTRLSSSRMGPEHVPQLLWSKDFAASFAELFIPGTEEYRARAFCSMSLLRLFADYTWKEAAVELGIPEDDGQAAANAIIQRLNRAGNADLFGSRLQKMAQCKTEERGLPNYRLRRRLLDDLSDIEPSAWARLCEEARVHRGKRGGRSVMAAVWLWCHLTGGSHIWAPLFLRSGDRAGYYYRIYGRFRRDVLYKLEDGLMAYGEQMLVEAGELYR